jgi:DNA adenine methylase
MPQNTVVKKKTIVAKPFVKWAGGKGNLLQKLEALLPANFDDLENVTYIEPFVGGGAMLFHMLQRHKCITRAVINDINADLIRCYELIARTPEVLMEHLKNIENNYYSVEYPSRKELFYTYRDQYNSEGVHPDERAALFIFLNHTCFNGLYRVNAAGKFNVPYGRYKKPVICNEELIMADHRLLNSVELVIRQPGDYKLVRQNLSRTNMNFVYFDPPYRPLNDTSSFKDYSNDPFEDRQQEELKNFCDRLSGQNCRIMQSNSDSKTENGDSYFEVLYEGYDIQRILASRFINADPEKRKKLTEVVIRNY